MANLFKWWVKFKVADRKTEKTWVTDVIILTRGLYASFAEICAKSKKKIFISEIPSFPSSMPQYGKISFFLRYFRYRFFVKFSKLQVGH